MKKLVIIIIILLLSISAFGITMRDLRSVRSNDIRIEYLSQIIHWAKDLRTEIEEEQRVLVALQKKGMLNQTQSQAILNEYETSIQEKFQSRPTLQSVNDDYIAKRDEEEEAREVLNAE